MRKIWVGLVALLFSFLILAAVISNRRAPSSPSPAPQDYAGAVGRSVPPPAASPPDDGNWTMPGKDYASTRFSGLNEITAANVGKLQVAMTFSTGTTEGFEAPPLVVNNTMYIVAPWPNNVFALDLTKPGAPAKWTYQPNPAAAAKGVACCGPSIAAYSTGMAGCS